MSYQNITVLALCSDKAASFADELKNAGFSKIALQKNGETVRSALASAAEKADAGIIIVSTDYGYSSEDVCAVADELIKSNENLYVGIGEAPEKKDAASSLFSFLAGIEAQDSQSLLFGMSKENAHIFTKMKSAEDTFLFNIPLEARAQSIPIKEVKTSTAELPAPGFSILTRSFKLYYVFIKFSISAAIAYVIDITTFLLFENIFGFLTDEYKILVSTILSRVLCSIATYFLNKGAVFQSKLKGAGVVVRFFILSAAQLLASWLLVWWIGSALGGSNLVNMLIKVVVDGLIFVVSFSIQRDWVFKEPKTK